MSNLLHPNLHNQKSIKRHDERAFNQARSVTLSYDKIGHSDASVLYELGNTKVLVSITLQDGVPRFIRGKK